MISSCQVKNYNLYGWYNVGPDDCDCVSTGELAKIFTNAWGDGFKFKVTRELDAPHEANFLKIDT